MELPFEEVWLDEGEGARRNISPADFLALPMQQRIRHILRGTVEFVHQGDTIGRRQALQALHAIECAEMGATSG